MSSQMAEKIKAGAPAASVLSATLWKSSESLGRLSVVNIALGFFVLLKKFSGRSGFLSPPPQKLHFGSSASGGALVHGALNCGSAWRLIGGRKWELWPDPACFLPIGSLKGNAAVTGPGNMASWNSARFRATNSRLCQFFKKCILCLCFWKKFMTR